MEKGGNSWQFQCFIPFECSYPSDTYWHQLPFTLFGLQNTCRRLFAAIRILWRKCQAEECRQKNANTGLIPKTLCLIWYTSSCGLAATVTGCGSVLERHAGSSQAPGHYDWGFSGFYSVSPGKCRVGIHKELAPSSIYLSPLPDCSPRDVIL